MSKLTYMQKLRLQGETQIKLMYEYGGKYNTSKSVNVFINGKEELQYGIYSIPLNKITGLSIRSEDDTQHYVKSRLTVTRMALLGPLALAAPKSKVNKVTTNTKYLIVDFDEDGLDSSIVFSGKAVNNMMNHIKKYLPKENLDLVEKEKLNIENNSSSKLDVYDEVKKLKELNDLGIVSDEEFETKKNELLGL